jgi:hemerythrin
MTYRTPDDNPSSQPVPDFCRTGEPEMDAEHLRLLTALQRLEESLLGPHGLETLSDRLLHLQGMTLEHFRNEEDLMARVQYPHLDLHRAEHELLIGQCRSLLEQFTAPDSPPLVDLARRLRELVLFHIQTVDRDYASFLERGGFIAESAGLS